MALMTRQRLQDLIAVHGMERYADAILAASKPAIHITLERADDDATLPVGSSKMGGSPDVPSGFVYPTYQGRPLLFIGQLRLSDVREYDIEHLLPPSGYLHFFYDTEEPWGMYEQRDGWRVFYTVDEITPLTRYPHPIQLDDKMLPVKPFNPCRLRFDLDFTEPSLAWLTDRFPDLINSQYRIETKAVSLYSAFFHARKPVVSYLLGNPMPVQYEVEYDAQVNSHNLSYGTEDRDARAALEREMYDWRLLLQVDSEEQLPATWGDIGRLYYMIRKDDLAARRFEACWLIMQCT